MSDDRASRLREIRQHLDLCDYAEVPRQAVDDVSWLLDHLDALTRERDEAREACPAVRMDRFADAPLIELVNEQVSQLFRMQAQAEASRATLARVHETVGRLRTWAAKERAAQIPQGFGGKAIQRGVAGVIDACADRIEADLSSPLPAEEKPWKTTATPENGWRRLGTS